MSEYKEPGVPPAGGVPAADAPATPAPPRVAPMAPAPRFAEPLPMEEPAQHNPNPPAPGQPPLMTRPRKRGLAKHVAFGIGGLLAGLAAGMLAGFGVGMGTISLGEDEPAVSSEPALTVGAALTQCGAQNQAGVTVLDAGTSLELRTAGDESTGAPLTTVVCILNELQIPESIIARMESTRALDGTVTGNWDGFSASWTYHPDDGLNVIVETVKK